MIIRYIGNFPPPYGGVTRKNQLLYEMISEKYKVVRFEKMGFMPEKIYQVCNILLAMIHRQILIIGISSKGGKSRFLTKLLYCFNRKTMQRSLYFMMGGTEAGRIAEHTDEIEWYRNYKQIYVETDSMVQCLEDAGLKNVSLFPNCRRRPAEQSNLRNHDDGRLKCVFFSLVQEMKGMDLILDTAEHLTEVDFFIYGPIYPDYEPTFRDAVRHLPNVSYQGIFRGNNEETYQELGKYDILLFPSKWKTEGVPGVLVEAKIAGVPAVVSNVSYNAELVGDGIDGFVLKENSSDELTEVLTEINMDRNIVYDLRKECLQSAEKFYIDNYTECILSMIGGVNDYIYLSKIENSESASKRPLRCVFFSFIEPEKGVDIILDSAKETPGITYHFYGHVQGGYADTFFTFVNLHKNVFYHGIFQGSQEEIYEELKKYDVLLLPTRWENEGVPGILIESKMVGLAEIVSDHNYNTEIVRDGTEGVILRKNTSEELAAVLNDLDANREVLLQLKIGSEKSAERYDVMNYINRIYEVLALM